MTTYKHVYEVTFETYHDYDNASSFVSTVHAWGQRHFATAKKVSITPIAPVPAVGQVWRMFNIDRTIVAIDGNLAWIKMPVARGGHTHYNEVLAQISQECEFVR